MAGNTDIVWGRRLVKIRLRVIWDGWETQIPAVEPKQRWILSGKSLCCSKLFEEWDVSKNCGRTRELTRIFAELMSLAADWTTSPNKRKASSCKRWNNPWTPLPQMTVLSSHLMPVVLVLRRSKGLDVWLRAILVLFVGGNSIWEEVSTEVVDSSCL